jgi:hypothetical protein
MRVRLDRVGKVTVIAMAIILVAAIVISLT